VESHVKRLRGLAAVGGASLVALTLLLGPTLAANAQRSSARATASLPSRPMGAFTPAVADPRLAAALARSGLSFNRDFRFTPATANERGRQVRVAVRARASTPGEAERTVLASGSQTPVTAITPVSYTLGASVGWRRFAITSDVSESEGGVLPGRRNSAEVGVSYRATRRISGRVAVAAERAEGAQRLVADDEAYQLDVGGAYSIGRNVDVTAGARYRIARDRLEAQQRDYRRDSQAVYIGTAFRF
jgi:hypothetical protein